jgi:predicted anti-sigma-YlaC factor YlaD
MAKMHIDDDDLELYALLGVVWHGAAAVEEHLLVCELCRDHLDRMDEYIEVVRLALYLSRLQ